MSALAWRDQRALWIGALIIVPVLAWRAAVMPLAAWLEGTDARVEAMAGLLAREQALLRDGPRLPGELATARRLLAGESAHLFTGTDTVGATAALAAWVLGTARVAGLTDVSAQSAPPVPVPGGLLGVQADVRASCDTRALVAWLTAIENGQRLVALERLDVAANGDGSLTLTARVRGIAQARTP